MNDKLDAFEKAKILEANAQYFGMSEYEMIYNAGKAIADEILKLIKENESVVTIVCGLGNNSADGLSSAYHLIKLSKRNPQKDIQINVLIIGKTADFKTQEAKDFYLKLKESNNQSESNAHLVLIQDAYAKDIPTSNYLVEALLGSGQTGKLNKRFKDVAKKISKMSATTIAVDINVPGYTPDYIFSLITPKHKNAKLLDINLPKEVQNFIGPGEVSLLYKPGKDSYKSQNGELLVIGGSRTFHGAPLMAVEAASKFIGSVFFYTSPEHREYIDKKRYDIKEFIMLDDEKLEKYSQYADVIMAGPGWEDNVANRALLTYLLNEYPDKLFVLDAYAIAMANPKTNKQNYRGYKNCILTPHRGELRHIFEEKRSEGLEGKLKRFCIDNGCMLVLKGSTDILFNDEGEIKFNKSGNAGMAKGGTGDILAGLIGAFATKNDPWLALKAATFINGLAGDIAQKEYGFNYSATDLIPFLVQATKPLQSLDLLEV